MRKLYIGLSRPKNNPFPILSWIIRLLERSDSSHSYLRWRAETFDRNLTYEASGTMVHFIGVERWIEKVEIRDEYEIELSDESWKELMQFCIDQAGTPYAVLELFGIAARLILSKFGIKLRKNPFGDGKASMKCTELVAHALVEIMNCESPEDLDMVGVRDVKDMLNKLAKEGRIRQIVFSGHRVPGT